MNELIYAAFFEEMTKSAGIGSWAAGHAGTIAKDTVDILRDSVDPRRLKQGLSEGLHAMSNMSSHKVRAMEHNLSGNRGLINSKLDFIRSAKGVDASKERARTIASHYRADYHTATPSRIERARQLGLLSGAAKYEGPSKIRKGLNMARRALPGEAAVNVVQTADSSRRALMEKEDETGRHIGLGERLGKAGVGATTSIVGMRGGFTSGLASGIAGKAIGARGGRLVDSAASHLHRHPAPVTGASPAPTGVK
jgi:hypothetical protein